MWFWFGRFWPNGTFGWSLNFIRLFNFVSSVKDFDKIMARSVDLVLFVPLSEIFFDHTLLQPFFVTEPLGFIKFEVSNKSTLWRSLCNDCCNKVTLLYYKNSLQKWDHKHRTYCNYCNYCFLHFANPVFVKVQIIGHDECFCGTSFCLSLLKRVFFFSFDRKVV